MKTDFKTMNELLKGADTFAIACHIRPDGDTLGSAISLRLALLNMGKKTVDIFVDDLVPATFSYLDDFDKIIDKTAIDEMPWLNHEQGGQDSRSYDLFVILDASTEDRIGRCTELRRICKKVLVVDHHVKTHINDKSVVVTNSNHVAVGSMLYEFFTQYKIEITREMATALYTAIATDTGCFMQANTDVYSHVAAGALIEKGIDLETINYNNFRLYNRKIIPGLAYALRKMKFFSDGEIAFISMPYKVIQKYQIGSELHQYKKYASEASGVRVGVVITERKKGEFNISLRSQGNVNMAAVAEAFGGGGHKNAAGFTVKGKHKQVFKDVLIQLQKSLAASET